MKKILLIILVAFSLNGLSQTNNTIPTYFSNWLSPPNGASAPTSLRQGGLWFQPTTLKLGIYNGSVWQNLLTETLASSTYYPLTGNPNGFIMQNGNTFGANLTIGANDNFGLIFKTNNTLRAVISATGEFRTVGSNVFGSLTTAPSINSSSALFPSSAPKTFFQGGSESESYSDAYVISHSNTSANAVSRQIGLLFKLSTETSSGESDKMGGILVESSNPFSNSPSLSLLTFNQRRVTVISSGNVGIGTANPIERLDITGKARVSVAPTNPTDVVRLQDIARPSNYTASGNGSATTISIPHGLTGVTANSAVTVGARNPASAGISYWTSDATNINIIYTVAPASGVQNLLYTISIRP